MLRLAADEDLNSRIVRGLRRRRPELDILPVAEAGLSGSDDGLVLEWAVEEGRLLVTHDANTMTATAWKRLRDGQSFPGLFIVPQTLDIGAAIDELLLLAVCSHEDEWRDKIVFLPLS